jgi:hypothetical protein
MNFLNSPHALRDECLKKSICATCGALVNIENGHGNGGTGFKDSVSHKEYFISATCQKCQDVIFAEPEEE